jgi:hypothetical protein
VWRFLAFIAKQFLGTSHLFINFLYDINQNILLLPQGIHNFILGVDLF